MEPIFIGVIGGLAAMQRHNKGTLDVATLA